MRRLKKGKYFLRNLRTNLWNGTEFYTVSILESFFYQSLIGNNRTIYDEYRTLVNTTHPRRINDEKTHVASFENFYSIYENIRDNGFESGSYIRLGAGRRNMGDIISDGQHRAAILLYLDYEIKVRVNRRCCKPVFTLSSVKQKETQND